MSNGPDTYREVSAGQTMMRFRRPMWTLQRRLTQTRSRARREAQSAYRDAVQRRVVLETLFDAINFFERIDPRLVVKDGPVPKWAFADFVNKDDFTGDDLRMIARPLGLDAHSVFLPNIVLRHTERRSAAWEPADAYFKEAVRVSKNSVPASAREIRYRIEDENGKIVGYGGVSGAGPNAWNTWDERCHQVWMDVNRGHRYVVLAADAEVALVSNPVRNNDLVGVLDFLKKFRACPPAGRVPRGWLWRPVRI
jgi:hypothetical protein